jgi:glycosyltransferase involved in cell wall biosynthesis
MKISVVMIVKNEEELLAKALESVKDADEIVVIDTGSVDSTEAIALQYTPHVYHFDWVDDFAAARNFAISKATGDWVYSLDADHELLTPIHQVQAETLKAEAAGHKTVLVKSISGKDGEHIHWREVLFKRDPAVYWKGAVHESLSIPATMRVDVARRCGYSGNHYKDPDRNLRILEKNEKTTRSKFYLGRENYERRRYDEAIKWLEEYLKDGKWPPEIAEAHLTIARCYWYTDRGDQARTACLNAIRVNPDFKEALLLMGNMHYEPWKSKWHNLASVATNKDTLFIRT